MSPQDLTYQAYKLYNKIRANSDRVLAPSDMWNRLYFLQSRAFYRYIRRLKLEVKGTQNFF
jgi:hypothetical protein